jgi:hypothetical protein
MSSLFYAGPSITRLHQDYAKQGRIDERAPVTATCEVVISAPVQRVWEMIASPAGWPVFDPAVHDVARGVAAVDTAHLGQGPVALPVPIRRSRQP